MSGDANRFRQQAGAQATHDGRARTRVFIVSDMRILRDGLTLALSQEGPIEVVGSSDLSVAAAEIAGTAADAILLDITVRRSLELARCVRDMRLATKVIALAVPDAEEVVIDCARAGVAGFVGLEGSIADVVAAVQSAIRGELECSPRTAGMLLRRVSAVSTLDELTRREREIMRLLTDGLSNKQIARALDIRVATVKNHVHSVLGKMGAERRGEVAALARRGFVSGPGDVALPSPARDGHRGATAPALPPAPNDPVLKVQRLPGSLNSSGPQNIRPMRLG
ncbi:MAG: response regulator transcription factor [Proteobacteria bacterium]|nr:response regulator transcription factor [Pseudomonadota bacterium]